MKYNAGRYLLVPDTRKETINWDFRNIESARHSMSTKDV